MKQPGELDKLGKEKEKQHQALFAGYKARAKANFDAKMAETEIQFQNKLGQRRDVIARQEHRRRLEQIQKQQAEKKAAGNAAASQIHTKMKQTKESSIPGGRFEDFGGPNGAVGGMAVSPVDVEAQTRTRVEPREVTKGHILPFNVRESTTSIRPNTVSAGDAVRAGLEKRQQDMQWQIEKNRLAQKHKNDIATQMVQLAETFENPAAALNERGEIDITQLEQLKPRRDVQDQFNRWIKTKTLNVAERRQMNERFAESWRAKVAYDQIALNQEAVATEMADRLMAQPGNTATTITLADQMGYGPYLKGKDPMKLQEEGLKYLDKITDKDGNIDFQSSPVAFNHKIGIPAAQAGHVVVRDQGQDTVPASAKLVRKMFGKPYGLPWLSQKGIKSVEYHEYATVRALADGAIRVHDDPDTQTKMEEGAGLLLEWWGHGPEGNRENKDAWFWFENGNNALAHYTASVNSQWNRNGKNDLDLKAHFEAQGYDITNPEYFTHSVRRAQADKNLQSDLGDARSAQQQVKRTLPQVGAPPARPGHIDSVAPDFYSNEPWDPLNPDDSAF